MEENNAPLNNNSNQDNSNQREFNNDSTYNLLQISNNINQEQSNNNPPEYLSEINNNPPPQQNNFQNYNYFSNNNFYSQFNNNFPRQNNFIPPMYNNGYQNTFQNNNFQYNNRNGIYNYQNNNFQYNNRNPQFPNYQTQYINYQSPWNFRNNSITYNEQTGIYTDQSEIYNFSHLNNRNRNNLQSNFAQIPPPAISPNPQLSLYPRHRNFSRQNNNNFQPFIPPPNQFSYFNRAYQGNEGPFAYNRMMPHFIPASRINFRNLHNNGKLIELLEEVEMTEEILNKIKTKECNICLDEYKIGEKICYLPCFHFFHNICIKKWVEKSKKCPLCNIEIKFE